MEFASRFVYDYDSSESEEVSEEEYEDGLSARRMALSSSSSDEDDSALSPSSKDFIRPRSASSTKESPKRKSDTSLLGHVGAFFGSRKSSKHEHEADSSVAFCSSVSGAPVKKPRKKKLPSKNARSATDPLPHVPLHTWRRADTNVVSIKFDRLTAPSNMHTGDVVYCTGCQAVFSHLSKPVQQGEEEVWICEFCGEKNVVDLMDEEKPTKDDVTFMLQPAPSTTASGKSGTDESLVIFCVDISGSMCVTTEVPGKIRLRGSERLDQLQSLNDTRESQRLPRQRRDVTYVSRLQGVQAGVDHQLGVMTNEHPNRRPALIAFNSEVTVVGDGSDNSVVLSGDCLHNWEELVMKGTELAVPHAVRDSRKTLGDKVFDLEEGGATALGPALLISVAMASQVPGSKVIICTDGLANVGLGSLDVKAEDFEKACQFYSDVSSYASEKGVSVSVLSIEGTDCKMVELGRVASITGGQVNIVDPLKLTQEFGSILSDPVIATNVTASFLLHKRLYIRHEENEESRAVRHVGNVTAETEITFEFGIRRANKKQKIAHPSSDLEKDKDIVADAIPTDPICPSGTDPGPGPSSRDASHQSDSAAVAPSEENLKELPFQLQITYTDLEGAQALRVITQIQPVTKQRDVAESTLNVEVMGVHAAQTSAQMAQQGAYTGARLNAISNKKFMARHAKSKPTLRPQYEAFYRNLMPMENCINEVQTSEIARTGRNYSDDDDDEEDMVVADCIGEKNEKKKARRKKVKALFSSKMPSRMQSSSEPPSRAAAARQQECDDRTATVMYQNINIKSKCFKK